MNQTDSSSSSHFDGFALLDQLSALIWITDEKGEIQYMNAPARDFLRTFGIEPPHTNLLELFHFRDILNQKDLNNPLSDLSQGEEHVLYFPLVELWTHEQNQRHVELECRRLPQPGFPARRYLWIIRTRDHDMELRKQLYLKGLETERKRVFEESPVMYVITKKVDNEPVIIDCNRMFLKKLGYSREEILGKPLYWLYCEDSQNKLVSGGYQRALEGKFKQEERILLKKNGQHMYTILYAVPERDMNGRVYGSRAMFVDISERKEAEQRLRRLYYFTETLREIIENMSKANTLDELMNIVIEPAPTLFQSEMAAIALYRQEQKTVECAKCYNIPENFKEKAGGFLEAIIQKFGLRAAYIIVKQEELPEEIRPILNRFNIRSFYYFPIRADQDLIGVIFFFYVTEKVAEIEELHFGKVMAENFASAVQKATAQQLLKESEFKYRQIFENVAEGIYQSTVDGKFITVNPSLVKMLGYDSVEEVLNLKIPEDLYLNPEDRLRLRKLVDKEGRLLNVELQLKRKDGKPITVLMNDRAVKDESGKVLYYEGTLENITERKKLEEALQMAAVGVSSVPGQKFFHSLIGSLVQVIECEVAFVGKIHESREHTLEPLVVVKHGILQDNETMVFEPAVWSKMICTEGICLVRDTQELRLPQGQIFQGVRARNLLAAPMINPENKILGIIGVVSSEEFENPQLAKSILKIFATRAAAELDRRIQEEERKKLEEQMWHAQKLESLGVLAGGIAHDFNNLLAGILGNADLARFELPEDSPAHEFIHQIYLATQRASDLTRQLLAYSGKGKYHVEPVNLSSLVCEIAQLLKVTISKKIELRFNLQDDLPCIEGDRSQLQQIIMNLFTNAAEAIGNQKGTIYLTTGRCRGDEILACPMILDIPMDREEYIFLEIRDTGKGMHPDEIRKIFDPFYTTKFTGRGLGLAAVLGIVRSHRGNLMVQSLPGSGTTFKVFFPASKKAVVEAKVGRRDAVMERGNGTILVVDDEEYVRNISARMLKRNGYQVLVARDGRRGLELYKKHRQDIVALIIDLTMPEMSGLEVVQEIRRISETVPVILSSGYSEEETLERFSDLKISAFLSKPFTYEELMEKLRKILKITPAGMIMPQEENNDS